MSCLSGYKHFVTSWHYYGDLHWQEIKRTYLCGEIGGVDSTAVALESVATATGVPIVDSLDAGALDDVTAAPLLDDEEAAAGADDTVFSLGAAAAAELDVFSFGAD